jgi:hypothetical protein
LGVTMDAMEFCLGPKHRMAVVDGSPDGRSPAGLLGSAQACYLWLANQVVVGVRHRPSVPKSRLGGTPRCVWERPCRIRCACGTTTSTRSGGHLKAERSGGWKGKCGRVGQFCVAARTNEASEQRRLIPPVRYCCHPLAVTARRRGWILLRS